MNMRKASTAAPLFIMAMLAGIGGIAYMMSLPGGVQQTVESGIEETRTATKAKALADYISEDYTSRAIRYNIHSVSFRMAAEGGTREDWIAGEAIPSENGVANELMDRAGNSFIDSYLGSGTVTEGGNINVPGFDYTLLDRYGLNSPYHGFDEPVATGPETNRTRFIIYEGEYTATGSNGLSDPPTYEVTVDYTFNLQDSSEGGGSVSIKLYTADGGVIFQDQASAGSGEGGSHTETFTMQLRQGNRLKGVLEAQSSWAEQQVRLNSVEIEPMQSGTYLYDLSSTSPSVDQSATAMAALKERKGVQVFTAPQSGEYTLYFDYRLHRTNTEDDAYYPSWVEFKVLTNGNTMYEHYERSRDPGGSYCQAEGNSCPETFDNVTYSTVSLNKGETVSVTMRARTYTGNPMSVALEAFRIVNKQTGNIVSNRVQGLRHTGGSPSPTSIGFSMQSATTKTFIPTERTQFLRGNRFFYLYNISEVFAKSWGLRNITADTVANVSNFIVVEQEQKVGTCDSDPPDDASWICPYNKHEDNTFSGSYPGTGDWELALNRQEEVVAETIGSEVASYEENVFTPAVLGPSRARPSWVPPPEDEKHYGNITVSTEIVGVEYRIDDAELIEDPELVDQDPSEFDNGRFWATTTCGVSETDYDEDSTSCGTADCDTPDIGETTCSTSSFGGSIPTRSEILPDDASIDIIGLTPPKAGIAQKIPEETTGCGAEVQCSGCYETNEGDGDYRLLPEDREETDPFPGVSIVSGSSMLSSYVAPVKERILAANGNGGGDDGEDECSPDSCCVDVVNYNDAYQTGRKIWRINQLTATVQIQVEVTDRRYYIPTVDGQEHMTFRYNFTQTSSIEFNEDGTYDKENLDYPDEPSPCWEWRRDADGDQDNRCRE